MVVFDSNFMLLLFDENLPPPRDPDTGQSVEKCNERILHLVTTLSKKNIKIIIPTPVIAEILVRADSAGPKYLDKIRRTAAFRVEPFDERSAIEVALMTKQALADGDKKSGSSDTWAKIKYDRQILAIAKVNGASKIYTNDRNLANLAIDNSVPCAGVHQLELPEEDPQGTFDLDVSGNKGDDDQEN